MLKSNLNINTEIKPMENKNEPIILSEHDRYIHPPIPITTPAIRDFIIYLL